MCITCVDIISTIDRWMTSRCGDIQSYRCRGLVWIGYRRNIEFVWKNQVLILWTSSCPYSELRGTSIYTIGIVSIIWYIIRRWFTCRAVSYHIIIRRVVSWACLAFPWTIEAPIHFISTSTGAYTLTSRLSSEIMACCTLISTKTCTLHAHGVIA